jgi:hypothetical protein
MPYVFVKEPKGAYRKFSGHVSDEEFLQSIAEVHTDPDFDRMRYSISDFLAVQSHSVSMKSLKFAVAHGLGAAYTNARMKLAVVTTDQNILKLVDTYSDGVQYQVNVFSTLADARRWIGDEP